MTFGMEVAVTALIRAVLMVYQAATAAPAPVVSATKVTPGTGGLLQSPVQTHGLVIWTTISMLSHGTTTVENSATQLVASGIKT